MSNNAKYTINGLLGAKLTRADAPVTTEKGSLVYPVQPGTVAWIGDGSNTYSGSKVAVYVLAGTAGVTASANLTVLASHTASTSAGETFVALASASVAAGYGFWARTSAANLP